MKLSNERNERRPWRQALNSLWHASSRSFYYRAENQEFQHNLDAIHNRLIWENQRYA